MDTLRLTDATLDKAFADLSGGEKQRVVILAALSLRRRVFLLDEATASLDAALKDAVVGLFGAGTWMDRADRLARRLVEDRGVQCG
jgi:ABC-type dipeptide/oligopeptide/nickel transport system ATPase subunit